nr:formyltransferase family protein [Salimicrobium jeotgali]
MGVCCEPINNGWREEESVYEYCQKEDIPILKLDEVPSLKADIGISVRFNKIISKEVIQSFAQGIFNTHGGILPEYRGSYCNINTILNEDKEFGVTLHYISEGVDTGDIVATKKVKVSEEDTGFTLYKKSEHLCYELLNEKFGLILNDKNPRIPQESLISDDRPANTYYSKKTLAKKELCDLNSSESLKVVKAFDSPHHEPAYIKLNDEKVYLRTTY